MMTYKEIEDYLKAIYEKYEEETKTLTSIQLPAYNARFERENGVKVSTGWGLNIRLATIIDDIGEVVDVGFSEEELGFWTKKTAKFPRIYMGNFAFSTKSNAAYGLKKGEKIRFTGKVKASLSTYEYFSISIRPQSPFAIKFFKI